MAIDGGDAEATLQRIAAAGIDIDAVARQLQRDGAQAFTQSWQQLLRRIADKAGAIAAIRP
jgi:transaldolase